MSPFQGKMLSVHWPMKPRMAQRLNKFTLMVFSPVNVVSVVCWQRLSNQASQRAVSRKNYQHLWNDCCLQYRWSGRSFDRWQGLLTKSKATVAISSNTNSSDQTVGGLAGLVDQDAQIQDSYAEGDINNAKHFGRVAGVAGYLWDRTLI